MARGGRVGGVTQTPRRVAHSIAHVRLSGVKMSDINRIPQEARVQ
jgi:hypothetical protein